MATTTPSCCGVGSPSPPPVVLGAVLPVGPGPVVLGLSVGLPPPSGTAAPGGPQSPLARTTPPTTTATASTIKRALPFLIGPILSRGPLERAAPEISKPSRMAYR